MMSSLSSTPLLPLLREDYRTHSRDWTRPGFRAMATYRFGVWAQGLRGRFLKRAVSRLYLMLHRFVRNHYTIEVHRTARIGRRVKIAHQGGIVIHRFAQIGDECVIRQNVTLGAASEASHHLGPILGTRVDIGAGAVIIGQVKIGDGARIGPNSVVTMDVPSEATVFGNPMRILPANQPRNTERPA